MKKLLAALVAGLAFFAPVSARAQDSKSTVISAINTDFADNTAGAITAALLRTVTTQMVSSYVDYILCGAQGGTAYWNGSSPPAPSCLVKGTNGQVLRTAPTPFWDNLANALIAGTGISITGTITPTITSTVSTGSIGAVPTSRIISSGAGLLGGGDLSADRTLSISAVIASGGPIGSSTTAPIITWNDKGQLTAVTTATISTGSLGAVPTSRIISSGAGLTGGGDLSADRTLSINTNSVTNAMLSQGGAATLHGNPTGSTANLQSFTISGLTNLASPAVTQDYIPIYDHLTGTIKNVTPQAIAAAGVAGVTSLGSLTGAVTLGAGLSTSGNSILVSPLPVSFFNVSYGVGTGGPSSIGLFKTVNAITVDNIVGLTGANATGGASLVITIRDCGTVVSACGSPVTIGTVTLSNTANVGVDGTVSSAAVAAGHYIQFIATSGGMTVYDFSVSMGFH